MKKIIFLIALFVTCVMSAQVSYLGEYTTTKRDGITIPSGRHPILYNSTLSKFQRYNGSTWETDISETEINTFAKLDAIVADKTLVNLEDAQTFTGAISFNSNIQGDETELQNFSRLDITDGTNNIINTWAAGIYSMGKTGGSQVQYNNSANEWRIDGNKITTTADGISDGNKGDITVGSSGTDWQIDADAVGESEIATNAVNTAEIATGAVTITEIATGAVGSDEILDDQIQEVDLEATNLPTDNYILTMDTASGGFTWVDPSTLGGGDLSSTDIDTYSELNTIVADVTLTHNGLIDTFAELDAIVADETLVNTNDSQTLTNKTIDASTNTISNIGATEIASTAVTPGSYTNTDITVDADGRITAASSGSGATQEEIEDYVGQMVSGNTETLITVSYNDGDSPATLDFVVDNDLSLYDNSTSLFVPGTISGRTGTTLAGAMIQTQAQITSDGDPEADEVVFCSDCAPAETFTGTAIPLDGYYTIDDTSTDTATWTLGTEKNGGLAEILINLASEPAVTGATQIPGTSAFESSTLSVLTVKVIQGNSYYYFTSLE